MNRVYQLFFIVLVVFLSMTVFAYENKNEEVNNCEQYENPEECLNKNQSVPYIKNGKIQGFKKIQNNPDSVYEKLQIKPGEVVTMPDPNAENNN